MFINDTFCQIFTSSNDTMQTEGLGGHHQGQALPTPSNGGGDQVWELSHFLAFYH